MVDIAGTSRAFVRHIGSPHGNAQLEPHEPERAFAQVGYGWLRKISDHCKGFDR